MKTIPKMKLTLLLKEAGDVFRLCAKKSKILSTLAWKPEVVQEFFKTNESTLPKPTYQVDRKALSDLVLALDRLEPKLLGEHPVLHWLQRTCQSFRQGVNLLLEIESNRFFEISTELYGNASTSLFKGTTSNLDLARGISARLSHLCLVRDVKESDPIQIAEQFAERLEQKIKSRNPQIPVRVEITDQIVAKVVAGMNRVRIRKDAKFSEEDLFSLWNHEIESHCLTAHNGSRHDNCDFLSSGGPRTTMTQEGLSVFYEVYGHTMTQARFLSLCNRVEAVKRIEDGADFIQVYRWYKDLSENPLEAFYSTQRLFRGARLTGGGPFTKDVVYIGGLLGVYNFLRFAAKSQNRLLVESLVCGRIALEDVATIAWLRARGIVNPPYFVPDWLVNWEALLSYFSLSAVLQSLDLSQFPSFIEDYHQLADWDVSL